MTFRKGTGFTIIELLVTLAILAILATAAFPLAETALRRSKESELRAALRQIRTALDAYKQAVDEGHIVKQADQSGYPRTLDTLVDGVVDAKDPQGRQLYFLRRIPRDPFFSDPTIAADQTWATRSYRSPPDAPAEGEDVFDVYSKAAGVGLNGIPYREW